jgi:hypothetical protein
MKRVAAVVVVALAVSAGASTLAASAAKQTHRHGMIRISIAGSLGRSSQPIVITGAFADAGKFTENAPNSKVILSKGSITVDDSKGAQREHELFAHLSKIVDPKTCGLSVSYTAPAKLKQGTGAYRGIDGTLETTTDLAGVFPRLRSGKCNLSSHAQPIGFVFLAHGSGRASLK